MASFSSSFSPVASSHLHSPAQFLDRNGDSSRNLSPFCPKSHGRQPHNVPGVKSRRRRGFLSCLGSFSPLMHQFSVLGNLSDSDLQEGFLQKDLPEVFGKFNFSNTGREGLWSVIIPTYNRLPILKKCLAALECQEDYRHAGIENYEVIVVDDGSTDGTIEFLQGFESGISKSEHAEEHGQHNSSVPDSFPKQSSRFPHVKVLRQQHLGAAPARNLGFAYSQGSTIVFIDSDLVVTPHFLNAHGEALMEAFQEDGDDRAFTYGCVINTNNFENPQSEPFKLTDYSAAFFATGNVAISRQRLAQAALVVDGSVSGPFDTRFCGYGWEDLELGVRLRQQGSRIKHAPAAVGYHWHPTFTYDQLPLLITKERERGRNGVQFYLKHPTMRVRLMVQMTPLHEVLWFFLTMGGLINEKTMEPLLCTFVRLGHSGLALALLSPILNWHTVQATKEELKRLTLESRIANVNS